MSEDRALALREHLQNHAQKYYAEFTSLPVAVRLTHTACHRSSTLYQFTLHAGNMQRRLVVKVPPAQATPAQLSATTDPATKFRIEYEALTAMHDYFSTMQDPRFAAIRTLDFIPACSGVVMEEVQEPSLRRLFARANRLHPWAQASNLEQCFRNAGGWLRAFHALPRRDHATPRDTMAQDFFAAIEKYTNFLAEALHEREPFEELARATIGSARAILPAQIPLGLTHGDYAMRNLLIGPKQRVRVIDTQAKWLMPIYEDLAYFLVGLVTTWPQVLSQGLAFSSKALLRFEQEFLSGYFEREPIPWETIRLFKIKIMLLKWSTNLNRMQQAGAGLRAQALRVRRKLLQRFYRKSLRSLQFAAPRN